MLRRRLLIGILLAIAVVGPVRAAVRVVTYNLNGGEVRTGLSDVLQEIGSKSKNGLAQPIDILVLQEMYSTTNVNTIRDQLNTIYAGDPDTQYASWGVVAGTDIGLVYNDAAVDFISAVPIGSGGPRKVSKMLFRPEGYYSPDAEFYLYGCHLKAGDGTYEEGVREAEVISLRAEADAMGAGVPIVYLGDMNFYRAWEDAWQVFTAAGNAQAFDPINKVGQWHNNAAYKYYHTQNPGYNFVGGGMDDRFDFQLVTAASNDGEGISYIGPNAGDCLATEESYHAFGNDGSHVWDWGNGTVTTGTAASPAVLQYLTTVSDHLPVVADYQIPARMQTAIQDIIPEPKVLVQNASYTVPVTVTNAAAVDVVVGADELDYEIYAAGGCGGTSFGPLPSGWGHQDIGTPPAPGEANYRSDTQTFRVQGSGDLTGTADSCHFAYQEYTGDFEISVRVADLTQVSNDAKAGLAVRDTLAAGAPGVNLALTGNGNVLWQHRLVANGGSTAIQGSSGVVPPVWLKITRSGETFAGYESTDGQNWTLVYQKDIMSYFFDSTAVAGYVAASGSSPNVCVADFGGDAGGGGAGTLVAGGSDQPLGNGAVSMVALDTTQVGDWGTTFTVEATSIAAENATQQQQVCYRVTPYSDFDSDGDFDVDDANLMLAALGTTDPSYDLNQSGGVIDQADVDVLVNAIFARCYGDLNLDGTVDQQDLQTMAENWLAPAAGWEHGNTDGDGAVGLGDFARLSVNWFCTAP